MAVRDDRWPADTPNWVDLSTPDPDVAKEFYAALLGWDHREAGGGYWLCEYGGREAAGIMGAESPDQPSAWTVYNEPGSLTWEEGMVSDQDYCTFTTSSAADGNPLGGLGSVEQGEQPGWRACFAVTDTDLAVSTATGLGGRVVEAPVDTPYGRVARIADPFGAELTLIGTGAA